MLVEIRRYIVKPGRRDEFVRFFQGEVRPAMEAAGMRILGVYVGVEDSRSFFYLRGFHTSEERDRQLSSFYQGAVWLENLRERALAMEESFRVELVSSVDDAGSTDRGHPSGL